MPSQWGPLHEPDLHSYSPLPPTAFDFHTAKLCQSDKYKMLYHYLNSPFMHNSKIVTFIFGHSSFLFCELPIFAIFELVMWLFFLLTCGMNSESIVLHKCITNIFCQSMTCFCCCFGLVASFFL